MSHRNHRFHRKKLYVRSSFPKLGKGDRSAVEEYVHQQSIV